MWARLLLLFFVFSFLFRSDHSFDQDLGRHLKLGGIIWQTGSIPQTNLFSYTNPDFPFINTHWLFEVWVYLMSCLAPLQVLLIIKIIIFLISVFLILKIIPKQNSALLLPVGFIFLHVLRERLELRPEIFSFFFTTATYYILERYLRGPTKLIFILPFIQLLWINTHIYFFVGLCIQIIFLLQLVFNKLRSHSSSGKLKLLAIIFALSVAISLINPYGLTGLMYPLNVTKNYGYTIVENQTIFLLESIGFKDPNFLFVKISIALIALSLIIVFLKKRFDFKNILLVFSGTGLALMNVRSFPYLVFLSLPATLENFGPTKPRATLKILSFIFGGLLLLESFNYLNGDYYRFRDDNNTPGLKIVESGKSALDFVINNNLPTPIYNNFDIGSYIIYRGFPARNASPAGKDVSSTGPHSDAGGPKYKVFVDGRPEAYPKDFFLNTYIPIQSDYSKFKTLEKQIGFKTIVFSHTDQTPWGKNFLSSVVKDNDWKVVYIDDFIIVLVLASKGQTLQGVSLNNLDPNDYSFNSYLSYLRMSLFLAQTGNQESAQKFAAKGLQLFPQSPIGNAMFGINVSNKFFW